MKRLGQHTANDRDHAATMISNSVAASNRKVGETTFFIKLKDISLTEENSRSIHISIENCIKVITEQFGEDYDVMDLPLKASDFIYLDKYIQGTKTLQNKTKAFFEGIITLAKDYRDEANATTKIGPADVVKLPNGKLEILAGNRRFYARHIAKFDDIECNKVLDKSSFKRSKLLTGNLKENIGHEGLAFIERFAFIRKVLKAIAEENGKSIHQIKQVDFCKETSIPVSQVIHIWNTLIADDFTSELIESGVITSRDMLKQFNEMNHPEKIEFVEKSELPELASLIPGYIPIDDSLIKKPKQKKKHKAKSFTIPKVQDPVIGKAIITALLKTEAFESYKKEKLGTKRVPNSIHEQAELIEDMFRTEATEE